MGIVDKLHAAFPQLSKGRKRLAGYILDNMEDAAYMTAAQMGEVAGLSASSVVRFSTLLGYPKFKQMQDDLLLEIKKYRHIAESIRTTADENDAESICKKVFDLDLQSMTRTYKNLDFAQLDDLAGKIVAARHVGIVTVRGGTSAGIVLNTFLNQLMNKSYLLAPGNYDMYDKILDWDGEDVVIGVTYFHSNHYIMSMLEYAKSKHCHVGLITNHISNAVNNYSDNTIIAQTDGAFISYTSTMLVVNMLINLVSNKLNLASDDFTRRMDELEKILSSRI